MIIIRFQRSVDGIYKGLIDKSLTSTRTIANESEFSGKTRMQKNAYRLNTLLPIITSLREIVSPRIPARHENQLRNHRCGFIRIVWMK